MLPYVPQRCRNHCQRSRIESALLAGHEMAGTEKHDWTHSLLYSIILALAISVIADLEYPRLGLTVWMHQTTPWRISGAPCKKDDESSPNNYYSFLFLCSLRVMSGANSPSK
jgi:hypothetical protein